MIFNLSCQIWHNMYIKNFSNLGAKYCRKVLDVSLVGEECTVHCSLYRRSCILAGGPYCSWIVCFKSNIKSWRSFQLIVWGFLRHGIRRQYQLLIMCIHFETDKTNINADVELRNVWMTCKSSQMGSTPQPVSSLPQLAELHSNSKHLHPIISSVCTCALCCIAVTVYNS